MSASYRVQLPVTLLPGSPAALVRLDRELADLADDSVVLDEAWMLAALPEHREKLLALAAAGKLAVANGWVRLDPYALPGYRAPNREGAKFVTGNAGGLKVVVDGEAAPSLGPTGQVRRDVKLDPDLLKAGQAWP